MHVDNPYVLQKNILRIIERLVTFNLNAQISLPNPDKTKKLKVFIIAR